jgi:tetratricopeptide (TPR) repeat protein
MRSLLPQLEKAHEAGEKVTEEEVLDGVIAQGLACMQMQTGESVPYFRRAKEGFLRLLREDHAKSVDATYALVCVTSKDADELIVKLRALWEQVKVTLSEDAVTYDVATCLDIELKNKGNYEEAKVLWLAALEGRRRVLGAEHKDTLGSLNNLGTVLQQVEDYEGALDYYQQALRGREKVLGKTCPQTLTTIMNMASTYKDGLKNSEEMKRHALNAYEK